MSWRALSISLYPTDALAVLPCRLRVWDPEAAPDGGKLGVGIIYPLYMDYTPPIHPRQTPYTAPIHPLFTLCTPPIHPLYTPYTPPIHPLDTP